MISVDNLTVAFNGIEIFKDVSFSITNKDRIGLIGKNGAGKTTLLKVIAGKQSYEKGKITIPDNNTVGYLPQQMKHQSNKTVFDEALSAFDKILNIEKEIEQINLELSKRNDYESDEYLKLIHELSDKNEQFHILDGATINADVEKILLGLGFKKSEFTKKCNEFSGGWRMRIELAKILLSKPNLLLLDEPTNHLDIESIQWLEDFLQNYSGAILIISHDILFLDNLTKRTIELSLGKLFDYKLPYTKFIKFRQEQRQQEQAAYENQKKQIEKTEEFIERFRYKATKAVQVQSKIKQLKKIQRIEVEQTDNSKINIRFPEPPRGGQTVVEIKNLSKSYGNNLVIDDINFTLEKGEKVAFVGKNGEGKTTLSRIIVGETDYSGYFKIGHNIKIGYFAQNQDEILDQNKTVFQTLDDIAVGDIRTKLRDILGAFLFRGDDIDKKVKVLSGGEQSRLAIAKLLLQPVNLLILDEPTNHLDIYSKQILKNALKNFTGTIIIVSHDRDFLNGLTNVIYEFKNHKIKQHLGGISDFMQKKKIENLNQLNIQANKTTNKKNENTISSNKEKYLKRKNIDKEIRKIKSKINKLENDIEKTENTINDYLKIISNNNTTDNKIYNLIEICKKQLDNDMQQWELLNNDLEKFNNEKNKL